MFSLEAVNVCFGDVEFILLRLQIYSLEAVNVCFGGCKSVLWWL